MQLLNAGVRSVIEGLRPMDTLSVIAFGSSAEILIENLSKEQILSYGIPELSNMGSTNYQDALEKTIQLVEHLRVTDGYGDNVGGVQAGTVLFFSDGKPDFGRAREDLVFQIVGRGFTFHTMGLGGGVEPTTLLSMAENGGGLYRHANTEDELQEHLNHVLSFSQNLVFSAPKLEINVMPGARLNNVCLIAPPRQLVDSIPEGGSETVTLPDIQAGGMLEIGYEVCVDNPGSEGQTQDLIEWRIGGAPPTMTRVRWVSLEEAMIQRPNTRPTIAMSIYQGMSAVMSGDTRRAEEIQKRLTKLGQTDPFAATGATVVSKTIEVGKTGNLGELFMQVTHTRTRRDGGLEVE